MKHIYLPVFVIGCIVAFNYFRNADFKTAPYSDKNKNHYLTDKQLTLKVKAANAKLQELRANCNKIKNTYHRVSTTAHFSDTGNEFFSLVKNFYNWLDQQHFVKQNTKTKIAEKFNKWLENFQHSQDSLISETLKVRNEVAAKLNSNQGTSFSKRSMV